MKILGRSSLNYERSQKRLHSNQRTIWRAAKMESATRCPPDAQDRMESCQDGASCQMPRTRWRAARMEPAARCPGPDGELPDGAELPGWSQPPPDAQASCQLEPPSCQMPRTIWRAARWNRAAGMEPTARCPRHRCPGPYGELPDGAELPGWSQLPDAHDTPPRAAKWNHPGPRPSCWSN